MLSLPFHPVLTNLSHYSEHLDPEMHVLEDAICLTFLALQFAQFNTAISDEDKMVS